MTTASYTIKPIGKVRWSQRDFGDGQGHPLGIVPYSGARFFLVLQEAWQVIETGEIVWRDVSAEVNQ